MLHTPNAGQNRTTYYVTLLPPPDQVSLYLWGTRPGDQAPSTNGNIQLIIQCFGFYNSAPRIRRSNPAWLWAFLRLLVSIHQSPWWYVYQSKKLFYFIMKRTELFWLTFWCPNFYSRLGKLLLIKVNLLKIVSIKMECYATPWPLWRDSMILYFLQSPHIPENLPSLFIFRDFFLFLHFNSVHASLQAHRGLARG